MTKLRTHYDNLKVSRDAPDFVIRAAYKTLSQKYHPDKHPGDERAARVMTLLNTSYEVLSNPARRTEHDAWIAREELKFKQQSAPQSPPIPPAWQQPPPVTPVPERTGNVLVAILLWPLKMMFRLFAAVPQLLFLVLLGGGFWIWNALTPDRPPPAGPKPYQTQAPPKSAPAGKANSTARRDAKAYVRPATAPNNSPWPAEAAYIKGYPIDNDGGYSKVTVDNGRNDADVFVKLVSLDNDTAYPVRQFFIPAHSRFTLNEVSPGKYDIRYRDLSNGGLSRSEAFDIEETRTRDGVQFSHLSLTLYKVQDGNFQTYDLSDSEF